MTQRDKVLVLGDDTRSFLSTVRSLGRQGLEVHVAPYDFTSPALLSRYIHKIHQLPYYLDGGQAWLAAMTALLANGQFSLVIPCDERGLLPLSKHREELSAYCSLAIPDPLALEVFFNKLKTRELAISQGVAVAKGRVLSAQDTAQSVVEDLGLPVVIKCPMSYSWPDLYVRSSTKIVNTKDALADWLSRNQNKNESILLEQMFAGFGVGLSVLCNKGEILQAFEHHRAHELDGSSYYRKSAPIDEKRLAAVAKMVSQTSYTGLAMFEFKVNGDTGEWILIEVNARPWGSLPLPVSIGVDFPYRLYRLLAKNEVTSPVSYPVNIYGRNLLQDLWQARVQAQTLARSPVKVATYLAGWLFGFGRLLIGREHQDSWVMDDARPGLTEIREFIGGRFDAVRSKISGPRLPAAGLKEKVSALASSPDRKVHVLFVCQGNINRSSYAELKSRQLFAGKAEQFSFSSAGMLPRNRRPSPQVAIEAASKRGVDMSTHLSRHAYADILDSATIIIVFDQINMRSISSRYPTLKDQVYLLGELAPANKPAIEILDPEGKTASTFASTYEQIDACLERLAEAACMAGKRP